MYVCVCACVRQWALYPIQSLCYLIFCKAILVGLARTVYIHRIWPYIWWFFLPKIPYIHHIYMVLANPKYLSSQPNQWQSPKICHSMVLCAAQCLFFAHFGREKAHFRTCTDWPQLQDSSIKTTENPVAPHLLRVSPWVMHTESWHWVVLNTLFKMSRVGQNHIYAVYIRYFWQGNHQIYGHIQCIHTVLANPKNEANRHHVKILIRFNKNYFKCGMLLWLDIFWQHLASSV